jgi:hypothetical protein
VQVATTYRWKALNEGYNFALDLILIGGLHTKLWASKVMGVPTLAIPKLSLGKLGTKCNLDVGLVEKRKVYYKRGRWWLLPNPNRGESCESELSS